MIALTSRHARSWGLGLALGSWCVLGSVAQAELLPGDVVIIGFQSDSPDAFAWVPLVDLKPQESLYFTDAGWFGGAFRGDDTVSDGGLLFTVPAGGLPAGTVQLVEVAGEKPPDGYKPVAGILGPALLPGTFGDQLAVFTGASSKPRFLFAVSTQSSGWSTRTESNPSVETELYPGLLDGKSAVAVGRGSEPGDEFDNAVYVGPREGTRAELLASVSNRTNWVGRDDPIDDLTNGALRDGFKILPGGTPFRRGDSNQDRAHDISDAISVFEFLFLGGDAPECLDAADSNDDGAVDISDGISLLGYLFLGGTPPAPPFEQCAEDPTDDAIGCGAFEACP